MDVSPRHIFSVDTKTVMQTWSDMECSKVTGLEPSVIVALGLIDGSISSNSVPFPILQILTFRISTDGTFPHLLALLSPKLIDCAIQIDPHKLCKRSEIAKVNSVLEENLLILRITDLPNSLARALLVNLTRVAYWLAIEALLDSQMDYFSVAIEFLFRVYSSCSHGANVAAQFLTSYMFNSLRACISEIQDSEHLSIYRIYVEILQDISMTSQHLSCILSEPTPVSVVSSLFKDLITLYAFKLDVSSERLTDLLKLVYLEINEDVARAWIKFWLVDDSSGIPMDFSGKII
ncbi:unnamed protein product [Hymenolepis diminuta]|uniref:Nuclear pore complex protein n=1 Tax=Hymenolepis diminuta TaxID=6216 RepID=A0A0R3SQN9_HYMDI|nr:unnamed protein product [Hymenolepis diminuta]